ncbi:zinc finger and BTB domain-containing protein 14-like isoform X2 [Maniola jurtina]|uniref:zinc finger and BTB domain-containing protein 14-like isoform X2 n=1 Tax=Maniola jurtina TaxID=191418 RepID=UPI001E68AFE7|nr:zinc finger and BTB domain-containing protein 14-like isoform X2 [Maniola jurtina]
MAMPEQFSLRWNDFHANLSQSFQALLEGEDLVDVTLAAGGQYVHAHKLILSVCSPYFKELFKMNPCEHPIVILKDVAHQELRQLLQFMYRGEVHVRTQELSAFLHTAELLQVKGLTGGRERSESPPAPLEDDSLNARPTPPEPVSDSLPEWVPSGEEAITPEVPQESVSSLVPKDEAARSPLKRLLKNTTNKNSYNIKKKPRPVSENSPSLVENTEYASDGELMIDFDNDMLHNLVSPDSGKESGWNCKTGGVKCPSCHRFFANRYNLKVHIRDKHDTREGTLQCDLCQKRMRNPSCLRVHMYHHRKQAAYLAQLSAQGDQMSVQNMVGNKWRTDANADLSSVDNVQNMVGNKWRSDANADLRDVDNVQNLVENKWRSDVNADLRDVDNYPASGQLEAKYQPPAETQSPVAAEAALPKVEANLETV